MEGGRDSKGKGISRRFYTLGGDMLQGFLFGIALILGMVVGLVVGFIILGVIIHMLGNVLVEQQKEHKCKCKTS